MPYLTHPSGQKTFYYDDCFANPWEPTETIFVHHGFGRNSNFWFQWVPVLAKKFRVIRRDALGHGYSSPPPNANTPKDVDAVLDDIIDTLDQLGIEKVHYLGESTGGIFGDFLAARNPERLHSLTICGSPLAFGKAGQDLLSFGRSPITSAIRELGLRQWGDECFRVLGTGIGKGLPDEFKVWWLEQFCIPSVEGVCAYAEVICRKDFDANLVIDKIKVPMLLLSPSDSPLVNVDDQMRFANIVGGQLELIQTKSHEIYLDEAEVCQNRYLKFLESLQ
ncbi:hypothetical protein PRZ48_012039 [Zasmidium cellare]|uniref:AB hydrolase-1 domain-containing protein n=1 Tax=Zasmidium cellare TaxID=395010 RepID=A0ABR0E465_ZASCE|nr:hypothetical protein PRZ48_012039 [Zasmidium cellare]